MSAHTQGPWHVDRGTRGVVLTVDGDVVASASGAHDQTTSANASLIAAAPDLLAALVVARQFIFDDTCRHDSEKASVLAVIEAALMGAES